MIAHLHEVEPTKRIFDATKELVKDVNLCVNGDGMSITAMDQAHVAILKVHIPSSQCVRYECSAQFILGLKVDIVCKCMASFDGKDALALCYDADTPDMLKLESRDASSTEFGRFNMKLMQIDSDDYLIPDIDFDVTITLPFMKLKKVISDLIVLGDVLDVLINEDGVTFSVSNTENGDGGRTFSSSDKITIVKKIDRLSQSFSLPYLYKFVKTKLTEDNVTLGLKDQTPMMLEIPIERVATMYFYLAPKMEEW